MDAVWGKCLPGVLLLLKKGCLESSEGFQKRGSLVSPGWRPRGDSLNFRPGCFGSQSWWMLHLPHAPHPTFHTRIKMSADQDSSKFTVSSEKGWTGIPVSQISSNFPSLPIGKFHFPSRNPGMQFLIFRPVPKKRNFQPEIGREKHTLQFSFAHLLTHGIHDNFHYII